MKPRVMCVHADNMLNGVAAYRYWTPYNEMRRLGYRADYAHIESLAKINVSIDNYDIISFCRLHARDKKFVNPTNKKIIYDIDDDFRATDGAGFENKKERARAIRGLSKVDAITTSTEHLKNVLSQYTDKPIYICPNSLNIDLFEQAEKLEYKNRTFALVGGSTHYKDWKQIEHLIPQLLDENPDWDFAAIGFVPDFVKGLLKSYKDRIIAFNYFLPYDRYAKVLKQIDVRLSPLKSDSFFNHSKSAIAAYEIMACEGISIAQNIVYPSAITDGHNGFLCETVDEWYNKTSYVLKNFDSLNQIRKNGLQWVKDNVDIKNNVKYWIEAYSNTMR